MEKIIEILSKLINKHEASILLYLDSHSNATGTEIERGLKLRQPQVSIATKGLLKKDMIKIKIKDKSGSKGRPEYLYNIDKAKIKKWFDDILDTKEKELKIIKDVVESWQKKA